MALQARSDMELWDRPFQTLLLCVLGVNIAAHALYVPWWILVASAIALSWKVAHLYVGWSLPPRRILYLSGALIASAVVWQYKTVFGHEAATPILVYLASIKLLETNRDRDALFVIVTSYFLLMAHLLHSQSLASTFFMAFDVAIITILMYQLHRTDRRISGVSLRPIVRLLVFTIPIWLCLFVVFPRFNLTAFRTKPQAQTTGFNEGLDPGSVSGLAQSDDVAFRVRFLSGPKRSAELMYWRGATLYEGDGLKWSARDEAEIRHAGLPLESLMLGKSSESEIKALSEQISRYEIITQPTTGRAVFTLPRIVRFEPGGAMEFQKPYTTADLLVRLTTIRSDHLSYIASSVLEDEGDLEKIDQKTFLRSTAIPKNLSQDFKRLIEELTPQTPSLHLAIRKIDDWFHAQKFRYTLTPGEAQSGNLDDFMFKHRRGFCEHFAAASATMLRAMGHPARVVVGYQGGRWNQVSKALVVRSRDAHAWVEVWFPSKDKNSRGRWLTYDPTASIAPLRLQIGGDFLDLSEEQQLSANPSDIEMRALSQNIALRLFDRTSQMWDFAQMSWTQFLLSYDRSGQRSLLNRVLEILGFSSSPWLLAILIATLFAILLRLAFIWNGRPAKESRLKREWLNLERELQRIGAFKNPQDGPLVLHDRVASPEVRLGIKAFIEAQYGKVPERENPHRFLKDRIVLIRLARRAARKLPNETRPSA